MRILVWRLAAQMQFDIILVVALIAAVAIFLQLRSVLGKRTGFERPPFDPYSTDLKKSAEQDGQENVISLPKRDIRNHDDNSDIDIIAPQGSELNQGLLNIRKDDPMFAPKSFIDGVRIAYEMIVTSFANADRKGLKPLLSSEVYDSFSTAISEREKTGETVKFTFIGIDKVELVSAKMQSHEALITLRIASEIISATYDKKNELVDGDPAAIVEIKDIWTFSRKSRSNDPNWKLVATQSDA